MRILEKSEGFKLGESRPGHHEFDVKAKKEISPKEYKTNINRAGIKKIIDSAEFKGVFVVIQAINLQAAIGDLLTDPSLKTGINTIGVTADITEASLLLRQSILKISSDTGSNVATKYIRIAGAAGGFISSGMCLWEAVIAYNRSDSDAAIAWVGAGIAFGISTAAGLGVAILAGPIGWIALGIGLGLTILANLLTDSELEFYFKHFIISDQKPLTPGSKEFPVIYSKRLLDARKELVEDLEYQQTLMHPSDAIATLFDQTVCTKMEYNPLAFEHKGNSRNRSTEIYEFSVSMKFSKFLESKEQVECISYYYRHGFNEKTSETIKIDKPSFIIVKDQRNDPRKKLVVNVGIPSVHRSSISYASEILIMVRICIDSNKGMYFPYPRTKEAIRYMAIRIKCKRGGYKTKETVDEEPVRIGTKQQLLAKKIWK